MDSFPTLSQNPSYPIDEDREDSTIRSDFEGGYQHTRPRYTRIRWIFDIRYKELPDADKILLENFINTVMGGANSFSWTHPITLISYTVRFDKPPKFESMHHSYWETEFQLKEV